jgi:hypothetical protein
MGLAEAQRLLARLSTDAALRGRFAEDPAGVAAEFGLSPEGAASLAGLPFGQLEDFARSLVRKRRGEVESLLPLTFRAVETAQVAAWFTRHARSYVPLGIKKHRDDAVAFAGFLAREVVDPPWLSDLARFEAAALLAHDPGRRWVVLRLRHDPSGLVRSSIEGEPAPKTRPTLVVWFRLSTGGRLRRAVLTRLW